jgi:hypothetical protein
MVATTPTRRSLSSVLLSALSLLLLAVPVMATSFSLFSTGLDEEGARRVFSETFGTFNAIQLKQIEDIIRDCTEKQTEEMRAITNEQTQAILKGFQELSSFQTPIWFWAFTAIRLFYLVVGLIMIRNGKKISLPVIFFRLVDYRDRLLMTTALLLLPNGVYSLTLSSPSITSVPPAVGLAAAVPSGFGPWVASWYAYHVCFWVLVAVWYDGGILVSAYRKHVEQNEVDERDRQNQIDGAAQMKLALSEWMDQTHVNRPIVTGVNRPPGSA